MKVENQLVSQQTKSSDKQTNCLNMYYIRCLEKEVSCVHYTVYLIRLNRLIMRIEI
jgi:hypothetical protein